jgi:O-antigen/teichoic acid export membrane protein
MTRFGGQVLGVEFVAMGRAWAEAAIIASTLGMAALGFMSIAQRLVQIVQDTTGGALVPVTTVAFARIRDSVERLRAAYLRALRLTYAALVLPLMLVAVAAPLMVPMAFGSGWSESHVLAQVLARGRFSRL